MIIHTLTSNGIVLNKITQVKYSANFLAYINYSINVNCDYIIMKGNQDMISTEFFQKNNFINPNLDHIAWTVTDYF